VTSFPDSEHDDQVDSVSQALEWLTTRSARPAVVAALRRQASPPPPGFVRMKARPGVNSWVAPYQPRRMVASDGTLDVEEQWVGGLLRAGWEKV
jgi:hypothetical protein